MCITNAYKILKPYIHTHPPKILNTITHKICADVGSRNRDISSLGTYRLTQSARKWIWLKCTTDEHEKQEPSNHLLLHYDVSTMCWLLLGIRLSYQSSRIVCDVVQQRTV